MADDTAVVPPVGLHFGGTRSVASEWGEWRTTRRSSLRLACISEGRALSRPSGATFDRTFGSTLVRRCEEDACLQAGEVFGELLAFGGIAEDALDHAHFSVEVVDHGDEDGFWGGGHSGGAPFFFALVTENNVLEALGQVGVEFGLDRGFAGGAETEYDVAL